MKTKMNFSFSLFGKILSVMFAILTVFVAVGTFSLFSYLSKLRESDSLVMHSSEVKSTIDAILTDLLNSETGERGYIITGDKDYLAPYILGVSYVNSDLSKLKELTKNNASQQSKILLLEKNIDDRLSQLKEVVSLHDSDGFTVAESKIRTYAGKRTMDSIRTLLTDLMNEEDNQLKIREKESSISYRNIYIISTLSGVITLVLISLTYYISNIEFEKRKKLTEQLLRSDEKYRLLIESVRDYAIFTLTLKGKITSWNPGVKEILGYDENNFVGRDFSFIFSDGDIKKGIPKREIRNALKGKSAPDERWHERSDGTRFFASGKVTQIKNDEGKIVGLTKIMQDITQKKENEQLLKYQKSLLEAQKEVSPEGILVVSNDGKIMSYNHRFAVMWGIPEGIMPKNMDSRIWKSIRKRIVHPQEFFKRISFLYKTKKSSYEKIYLNDGRIFDRHGSPIKGEASQYYGYVWFFLDITEQEVLARQKDDFIGIASHELKTPVTSIKAYTQVLLAMFKKKGNEQAVRSLSKMDTQLNKLSDLIRDLLDVTKIESGRLKFNEDFFDFDKLVQEVAESFRYISKKHRLVVEGRIGKKVFGDPDRTGQVITNLISNAIKYSPHSDKVLIHISVSGKNARFCVRDFGVGISKEKQARVFERFYRVNGPEQNTFPGLGLGLYISSEIVRRQEGRIWVESVPGKGSNFCFTLPLKK